jgi:hypothetical protein
MLETTKQKNFDQLSDYDQKAVEFIKNYEGSIESLPYAFLFWHININPDSATTVIPFLRKDTEYNRILGKVISVTDLDGFVQELSEEELVQKVKIYQKLLPKIELIPADLSLGFPNDFPYKADLLILNHGIILPYLRGTGNGYQDYLESISKVTTSKSLLMLIDNGDTSPEEIEQLTGKTRVEFRLTTSVKQALKNKGLDTKTANEIGDLFTLPEANRNQPVVFFQ